MIGTAITGVRAAAAVVAAAAALAGGGACTPDVDKDPTPASLEFDPDSAPPRVPQPTALIFNQATGMLDFSLAGIEIPDDCAAQVDMPQAECEFNRYLETLDGFPTVTPAEAPATAALDPASLTLGQNVFVVSSRTQAALTDADVAVGFDAAGSALTVRPRRTWPIGDLYWVGVRGYGSGVRTADGSGAVVGSPTIALLKQEAPLGDDAVALLAQTRSMEEAEATVVQLEHVRQSYAPGWALMEAAGLPKSETAVLWGFPIHSSSVAEIDPTANLLPVVMPPNEIRVAVQGPVDPTTVSAFVVAEQQGPVVLMDLTAAAANDLVAGFPRITASYADGAVVIRTAAPLVGGHQYGVFLTRGIHDNRGRPLVPSPISVLLTLRGPLRDAAGKSNVSTLGDADAALLEAGRQQLITLFDNPVLGPLTGVSRDALVYCFALSI